MDKNLVHLAVKLNIFCLILSFRYFILTFMTSSDTPGKNLFSYSGKSEMQIIAKVALGVSCILPIQLNVQLVVSQYCRLIALWNILRSSLIKNTGSLQWPLVVAEELWISEYNNWISFNSLIQPFRQSLVSFVNIYTSTRL